MDAALEQEHGGSEEGGSRVNMAGRRLINRPAGLSKHTCWTEVLGPGIFLQTKGLNGGQGAALEGGLNRGE